MTSLFCSFKTLHLSFILFLKWSYHSLFKPLPESLICKLKVQGVYFSIQDWVPHETLHVPLSAHTQKCRHTSALSFFVIKHLLQGCLKWMQLNLNEWLFTLTWNLPVSALAWARVQGQSMISLRKLGSWFSNWSHAKHLSRAQTIELSLNFCSRCQARAWSSVHAACTFLNETCDKK